MVMARNKLTEDGEILSETDQFTDGTNLSPAHGFLVDDENRGNMPLVSLTSAKNVNKAKRPSRFNELSKRFTVIEEMLQKMLKQNSATVSSYRQTVMSDGKSDDDYDRLCIFANGQISPSHNLDIDDVSSTATEKDGALSDEHKKCLF